MEAHKADYNIQATKSKEKWDKMRKTNAKEIGLCYNISTNNTRRNKLCNSHLIIVILML